MTPASRKRIGCREIFVFRCSPWVRGARADTISSFRVRTAQRVGYGRQNVSADNGGRDSPSRVGTILPGLVVCQLALARTDGSWQRKQFRRSLARSQETGSRQTATATEQASSGAANGEGQRGQRESVAENRTKEADTGRRRSRGKAEKSAHSKFMGRPELRAPRFARHL